MGPSLLQPTPRERFVHDLDLALQRCAEEIDKFTLVNLSPEERGERPYPGYATPILEVNESISHIFERHLWVDPHSYISPAILSSGQTATWHFKYHRSQDLFY